MTSTRNPDKNKTDDFKHHASASGCTNAVETCRCSRRPDQFWGQPRLVSVGIRDALTGRGGVERLRDMKLTNYLHLVSTLEMSCAVPSFPPCALMTSIGTKLLFFTLRHCIVYILTVSWNAFNGDKHFFMDFISDPVWACWRKYELWTCSKGFVCFWEQGVPHSSTFF